MGFGVRAHPGGATLKRGLLSLLFADDKMNIAKFLFAKISCRHSLRFVNRSLVCARIDFLSVVFPRDQQRKDFPKWLPITQLSVASKRVHTSCRFSRACVNTSLTQTEYESLVTDTLESLAEFFEELPEKINCAADYDVAYHDGVLTVVLGRSFGTYVINKQSPNRQIWLSSPKSGPKRYDYECGRWIYRRNGEGLHTLLEKELSEILQTPINLSMCVFHS